MLVDDHLLDAFTLSYVRPSMSLPYQQVHLPRLPSPLYVAKAFRSVEFSCG